MLGYLIILFTVIPAIELMVLIEVGSVIGSLNTILIIIFTGVLGAYMARIQGFYIIQKVNADLQNGIMPTEEMMDGLMVLAGGILLLTPGFITDTLGFLLLIPFIRLIIKQILRRHFDRMIHAGQMHSFQSTSIEEDFTPRDVDSDDDIEDANYF